MHWSICLLAALSGLTTPILGHHIGFRYSPEKGKERTKIGLTKGPVSFQGYPGKPRGSGGWYDYTQDETEIKSDEIEGWLKSQIKNKKQQAPEEYSLTKSHEVISWSHVPDDGKKSGAPSAWYEKEQEPSRSYPKHNSKYKDPISWVQVSIPELPSKPKIEFPSFEKYGSFEKHHTPSHYFSKDSVSWPPAPPQKEEPKKKKKNETHWIWNHKLGKLEQVEKKPESPKPTAQPTEAKKAPQTSSYHFGASKKLPQLREHGKVAVYTHEIPVPYQVKVEKEVRYPVHVPEDRPVPYTVYKHYPVVVEKKVPVPVKVNVPFPVPIYKEVKVPVKLKEERLAPFNVHKQVPVYFEKPVHFILEKKVPFPVKEVEEVQKPYPVKEEKDQESPSNKGPKTKKEEPPKAEKEESLSSYDYSSLWKSPEYSEEAKKEEGSQEWDEFLRALGGKEEQEQEGGLGHYYKTVEESQEGGEDEGEKAEEAKKSEEPSKEAVEYSWFQQES